MKTYLTSSEAAQMLNVSQATLYAYVSRGLIRSESGANHRARIYHRLDLERLKERKKIRKEPSAEMSSALYWGNPLLESGLTLIADGQLFYRGREATVLAATQNFFAVAVWFWTGNWVALPSTRSLPALKKRNGEPTIRFQESLLRAP